MNRVLALRNRQRVRPVETRLLRSIATWALQEHFRVSDFELGIHLVGAEEMACVNERFLAHEGSTDVITFDHRENSGEPGWRGEIYISLDDAVAQARKFGTTWPSELARYLLHGLLHLHGFDDLTPAARRRMKREENRLLREAAREFVLSRLARKKF